MNRTGKLVGLGGLGVISIGTWQGMEAASYYGKLTDLRTATSKIHTLKPQNKKITTLLDKLNTTMPSAFDYLFDKGKTEKKLAGYSNQFSTLLKNNAQFVINVGVALDGTRKKIFENAVRKANEMLAAKGLYVKVDEFRKITLPSSFSMKKFKRNVRNSFSKNYAFYFVHSNGDYSQGRNNYAVNSMTSDRITLIDSSLPPRNLEKVVAQEVFRLVSSSSNTTTTGNLKGDYKTSLSSIDAVLKYANISKYKKRRPVDPTIKDKMRVVTVNIGLDGTTKEEARAIFERVSENYSKEFGISFKIVGMYNHKLPESWNGYKQLKKMKNNARTPSDIYLLFTSTDWGKKSDEKGVSTAGTAYHAYGAAWIETGGGIGEAAGTTKHEIGHFFRVNHTYLKHAVMHPHIQSSPVKWSDTSRQVILQNKYRTWRWSPSPKREGIKGETLFIGN